MYFDLLVSADCQRPPHREGLSAVVSDAHKPPGDEVGLVHYREVPLR